MTRQEETIAEVWIQCPFSENTRHKLQKGTHAPYYDCRCLGIELGSELKEGDEVMVEEINGN